MPTISGSPTSGQTLTLNTGTWSGTSPLAYGIVWQRCDAAGANCQAIAGETGSSYTLTPADVDATIRALVTASNGAGITGPVPTLPTALVTADPPVNTTTPPNVIGSAVDGQTLTADEGIWTGTQPVVFTYQWQDCDAGGIVCTDIAGATNPTYTLAVGDIGSFVRVEVTATNIADDATATSVVTAPVLADPPANTSAPTLSGSPRDGQTLMLDNGTWTGTAPLGYVYQWLRCAENGTACAPIAGATGSTYVLTGADIGHAVRAEVTASNVAGSAAASSAPTTAVIP